MRTLFTVLLVFGLGAFVLGCKKRADPAPDSGDKDKGGTPQGGTPAPGPGTAGKPGKWGTFAVGKATTVVTGPVDSSGHIDFAAAANERMSKGVTAENNANVAIWRALGPNPPGGGRMPAGFFEKMGMQTPPAAGAYFVGLRPFADRAAPGQANFAFDAMTKLSARPWAAQENATIQGWLQANEKPMAALAEAVKRTHYYNPVIPETTAQGSKGIMSSLLPGPQACREVAGAFACRAMLYLGHNQPAAAWNDLLTCHRLGRLVGRGGTLIEGLVGMAIEQIACRADIAFLDRVKPDAKSIEMCLKDLLALPPLPDVAEKVDVLERYSFLDTVMLLNRYGVAHLTNLADGQPAGPPAFNDDILNGIDWNPALETANKYYDRLTAALREKDRPTRNQKLTEVENDLHKLKSSLQGGAAAATLRNPAMPATTRGADLGSLLVTLLMPAARKVQDASDRATQSYQNVITAYACVWYHRFNGKYPDKLADLVPTYLNQVPKDIFTGKDLLYIGGVNGFSFHSVGPNGFDDSGDSTPPRDDIGVRIPVPPRP
jgi:hypothetical protein